MIKFFAIDNNYNMTINGHNSNQHHETPAFLVPVVIRETPQYGEDDNQKGVFAKTDIPAGTKMWVWTDRVISIHHQQLEHYIATNFGTRTNDIQLFLRQGFVLPKSSTSASMKHGTGSSSSSSNDAVGEGDDYFHSNPTDCGRFTNHSKTPNMGPDALRDIVAGEELTMDYSFHGNPEWYQTLCARYDVLTEAQIAALP